MVMAVSSAPCPHTGPPWALDQVGSHQLSCQPRKGHGQGACQCMRGMRGSSSDAGVARLREGANRARALEQIKGCKALVIALQHKNRPGFIPSPWSPTPR